jgi:hypothetical protein
MKTPSPSARPALSHALARTAPRRFPVFAAAAALGLASTALFAQTTPATPGGERSRRGEGGGERGSFNPQEMQNRMLNALRDRLEVTDDEEWKLISARIAKVTELRRATGAGLAGVGGFAGRGGPPGGGDNREQGRGGPRPGGSAELAALSSAVRDKLPDAEIKSRLDRLRETRKENEAKLTKAQEELRAVLSIRQEAVAVVFGLLP